MTHHGKTSKRVRTVLLATVLLLSALPARGQEPLPDMVPVEMLVASSFGGGTPEILLGRVPADLEDALPIPPDARVVGTIGHSHYQVVVLTSDVPPAEVQETWTARFLAAGWTRREAPRQSGFGTSGSMGTQLCGNGSVSVHLSAQANPRGAGSLVEVRRNAGSRFSICDEEARRRPFDDSPIPSLSPPAGARSLGSGGGGSGNSWSSRTALDTDLGPAALLDHYGEQLERNGWTGLERSIADRIGVATYRFSDDEGVTWHGVLTAFAPVASGERLLLIDVSSLDVQ